MRFCTTFLLTALTAASLWGQVIPFPEDQAALLKQLETVLNSTGRKDMKDAYALFEEACTKGRFTTDQIKVIAGTLNRLQSEKMAINPNYGNYLSAVVASKRREGTGYDAFKSWHKVLDQMINIKAETKNAERLKDFLAFSGPFLHDLTLRESEGGIAWKATSDKFDMLIEDKHPVIVWAGTDLKLIRKNDSLLIYNTSGRFLPLDYKWSAQGGEVRWGDRIVELKDVKAELGRYQIDVRRGLLNADSVQLTYPLILGNTKALGSIEDKLVYGNDKAEGSFPRFESYSRKLSLQNLGPGVTCVGGLKLYGFTIFAVGDGSKGAVIEIYDRNMRRFRSEAQTFSIKREERIAGEKSEISLYFGKDSIYHPAVNLRYDMKTRELELRRGEKGTERNPFSNSYHQFTIAADRISWNLDRDSIFVGKRVIGAGDLDKSATFESSLYFQERDYIRLQNIADYNPIAKLKLLVEKNGKRELTASEMAKSLDTRLDAGMIQPLLFDLSARGFIKYDIVSGQVTVLDKVLHYADASQRRVDYDVIRIYSQSEKFDNAVISLRDTGMVINAVESFELSEKQKVALRPDAQYVTCRQDRNIDFDGRLFAGYTTYMGRGFHFNYNKFAVELDSVRFMDIYIPTGRLDEKNKPEMRSLKSRIEYVTGILQIDAPNNKSGREELPFFPSIQSRDYSYVFYEYPETQKRAYKADSFYFKLDKFFLNSLDSLLAKDVTFKGQLYSYDIFPVIKEQLEIMPDTSLGIYYTTPGSGLPNYRQRGNYTGDITLSNFGLTGKGTLTYLGSTCVSDSIIFQPKLMYAAAKTWENREDRNGPVKYPQVIGKLVGVDWRPYNDSMYVHSRATPFDMFKANDHKLTGTLILTPRGTNARGALDWSGAVMKSHRFVFGAFVTSADTTSIDIKTKEGDQIAVAMDNINGTADFDTQQGKFRANDAFGLARLPAVQYVTNLNEFDWDMKAGKVDFRSDATKMAGFTSVHPDQDSLYFQGKTALYDISAKQLNVGGVPVVQTCDAYIYPSDGKIVVREGAVMETLRDTRIVCDTVSKHHVINRANADIKGKKLYTATGFYEYNVGPHVQEILFDDIVGQRIGKGSQSTKQTETRASGFIKDSVLFYMDHKMKFRGKIELFGSRKDLQFDGYAQFDVLDLPSKQWFSVHSSGDKQNLYIAYDKPQNPQGDPLRTGIFISAESNVVYPRMMHALYFSKDRPVIAAKGLLHYDPKTDEFIMGDTSKVLLKGNRGIKLTYQVRNNRLVGEGPLEIGSGLKNCKLKIAGRVTTEFLRDSFYTSARDAATGVLNLAPHTNSVTAMAGIKYEWIPDNLLRIMAADILANTFDAPELSYSSDLKFYEDALAELIADNKLYLELAKSMRERTLSIPERSNPFDILLGNVRMRWDQENQSFVSEGSRLGVNSIAGQTINKQVTGYMEVRMPKNEDDRIYIYLKTASDVFYFIGFAQGVLSVTSNNEKFNQAVLSIKAKDLVRKLPDGSTYELQYVEPSTASAFAARVQAAQQRK